MITLSFPILICHSHIKNCHMHSVILYLHLSRLSTIHYLISIPYQLISNEHKMWDISIGFVISSCLGRPRTNLLLLGIINSYQTFTLDRILGSTQKQFFHYVSSYRPLITLDTSLPTRQRLQKTNSSRGGLTILQSEHLRLSIPSAPPQDKYVMRLLCPVSDMPNYRSAISHPHIGTSANLIYYYYSRSTISVTWVLVLKLGILDDNTLPSPNPDCQLCTTWS